MDKKNITKEYKTDDITIVWKPDLCIHAALCVDALPKVYQPNKSPWISIEEASTKHLIEQIHTCPSGALSYKLKNKIHITNVKIKTMENSKVAAKTPMMVDLEAGKNYAWCACGHSTNQPWCDGSHKGTGMKPVIFKVDDNKKAAMCMCKQTKNSPYCDGSHSHV